MRWFTGTVIIGAFLVLLYFTALPGDLAVGRDDPDGIAGTYTINGVDPQGTEYSGTVVIVELDNGTYDVEWIITNAIQRGNGIFSGDRLEIEWATTSSVDPATGRTVYTLQEDGGFSGVRFVDGVPETSREDLFPDG